MKTYVQLTYEQRCQIYALINTDLTQQKIADAVGVSQSAISRELKRNRGKRGYRYQQAQGIDERPVIVDDKRRIGDWEMTLSLVKDTAVRW